MDVPLRVRDVNACAIELFKNFTAQVTIHAATVGTVLNADPVTQGKDQGVIAQVIQHDHGFWHMHDVRMLQSSTLHQILDLHRIRPVSHPDPDLSTDIRITECPVREFFLNQLAVRNQRVNPIRAVYGRKTDANRCHPTTNIIDLDQITDPDGTLDEQHDATDQVLQQVLGTKTHANC